MTRPGESSSRITTRAEQMLVRSVLLLLGMSRTGDFISVESEELQAVLSDLECFVPEVLGEVHSEWKYEGVDAIIPLESKKTGVRAMCVVGQCILVSDQTVVPLKVELQVCDTKNRVSWFDCRLGEKRGAEMIRTPYRSLNATIKAMHSLRLRMETIRWFYRVGYGEKCS